MIDAALPRVLRDPRPMPRSPSPPPVFSAGDKELTPVTGAGYIGIENLGMRPSSCAYARTHRPAHCLGPPASLRSASPLLRCTGNSCYMNSVVQTLFALPEFRTRCVSCRCSGNPSPRDPARCHPPEDGVGGMWRHETRRATQRRQATRGQATSRQQRPQRTPTGRLKARHNRFVWSEGACAWTRAVQDVHRVCFELRTGP